MPEKISGAMWRAWWGPKKDWIDAPELRSVGGAKGRDILAQQHKALEGSDKTVHLLGSTPSGLRHEFLGAYEQREGELVGGRRVYVKRDDPTKMLWHHQGAGTWYMGGKAMLGQRKGVLKAHDTAIAPEQIKPGIWVVGQGEGKGWLAAPTLKWLHGTEAESALNAEERALAAAPRTVYLFGDERRASGVAPPWQGAYTVEATANGRRSYAKPADAPTAGVLGSRAAWMLWYNPREGTWQVSRKGKRTGKVTKSLLSVYDGAQVPDQIHGGWRLWKDGGWTKLAVRCLAGAEGEAAMRQQKDDEVRELSRSAMTILLDGSTPNGFGHEWLGAYAQRSGSVVARRYTFTHEADDGKALWFDARTGRWCVGPHEAYEAQFHPNKAVFSVVDAALAPERISAAWMLRSEAEDEAWIAASTVRAVAADGSDGEALRRTRARELNSAAPLVYLVGATPASFPQKWMGPYELDRTAMRPDKRHTYRRQGDPAKMLQYHPRTGDWRVTAEENGATTTVLSGYDGAVLPEHIAPGSWRSYTREVGWEDAPDVACKSGLDGKMAMDADLAVEAVKGSLTPGWLFPVRAEAVVEKLKAALAAGAHPSRLHAILLSAEGREGVSQTVLQAARVQLGPLVDRPRVRPLKQPMPAGQSWRALAGLAVGNRTAL